MTLPGYFWDRWPYFAGKLSWDITTTQVNSAYGVAKSSTSFGWGKGGKVTSAGWQVTLCDLIWHVISRSGVVISITNCYIRFTLLYLLYLTLPVFTARVHDWRFWHPWTWAVNMSIVDRCPCSRPAFTSVENVYRNHRPWTRVVCTRLKTLQLRSAKLGLRLCDKPSV